MRISDWSSDVCSSDLIIAVAVAAVASALVGLPVETIGTRFGGIPQTLPMPHLPEVSYAKVIEVLQNALSLDRKRVVEGKSVSVSLDLGGLCLIQQKTYITNMVNTSRTQPIN